VTDSVHFREDLMELASFVKKMATLRTNTHTTRLPKHMPIIDKCDELGLWGEQAFSQFCGIAARLWDRSSGDGGVDFVIPWSVSVDVKTVDSDSKNLIHPAHRPVAADFYVLCERLDGGFPRLVGYSTARQLLDKPIIDLGRGEPVRLIKRYELKPMIEMEKRMWRWGNDR